MKIKKFFKLVKKTEKQTDRTLGQMVKAKLYRQNHTQKHTHTHSQKEKKGRKNIYLCSQSPPPQFGTILLPTQVFSRCRYIKLFVEL